MTSRAFSAQQFEMPVPTTAQAVAVRAVLAITLRVRSLAMVVRNLAVVSNLAGKQFVAAQ